MTGECRQIIDLVTGEIEADPQASESDRRLADHLADAIASDPDQRLDAIGVPREPTGQASDNDTDSRLDAIGVPPQ